MPLLTVFGIECVCSNHAAYFCDTQVNAILICGKERRRDCRPLADGYTFTPLHSVTDRYTFTPLHSITDRYTFTPLHSIQLMVEAGDELTPHC